MKTLKKITAMVIVCIMALSLTACHKKNEIAVTIDGQKYTSAYYMCALLNAYTEAKNLVYNDLSDDELSSNADIDFNSKKVENKKFGTWVKDTAIENLKAVSYYKSMCKKNKLELTEEATSSSDYYASMYWSSYGYSQLFEPNGVSEDTFKKYMADTNYSALYFEYLYGKGGEKEIPSKTVKSKFYKSFLLADILEVSFSEESDSEKKEIKKQFKSYYDDIKSGKLTFEDVYIAHNKIEESNQNKSKDGPKDQYATVIGDEGTGYEHDYYKKIKSMKTDEVKLFKKDNDAGYLLVVKKDIKDDNYYLKNMDMNIRHLIKDDEFTKDSENAAAKLDAKINKYAVSRFKVNKIIEPSYQ